MASCSVLQSKRATSLTHSLTHSLALHHQLVRHSLSLLQLHLPHPPPPRLHSHYRSSSPLTHSLTLRAHLPLVVSRSGLQRTRPQNIPHNSLSKPFCLLHVSAVHAPQYAFNTPFILLFRQACTSVSGHALERCITHVTASTCTIVQIRGTLTFAKVIEVFMNVKYTFL